MKPKQITGLFIAIFILHIAYAQEEKRLNYSFSGQAIGWTNINFSGDVRNQWGFRYIPELSGEYSISDKWKIDTEASLNGYGAYTFSEGEDVDHSGLKPYRLWLRLSSNQFELRAGLQKINFGTASMLRPLMWFDKIDPRDPLQLTDGVYGLLARYYFLNNANIWAWVLYGNESAKGWEILPGDKKTTELGGRVQLPVFKGEFGLSYHYRPVTSDSIEIIGNYFAFEDLRQNRLGIDGKWDIGAGVWFEYVLKKQSRSYMFSKKWDQYLNLGVDYTFGIGSGLTIKTEHFMMSVTDELFKDPDQMNFTASSLSYSLGLTDRISGMLYYNWEDGSWYRFINFNRTYDRISLYVMGYWNPETFNIYRNVGEQNLFSGKGLQFMIVFNH